MSTHHSSAGEGFLVRRVGDDHPAHHQVEEEHGVHCQGSPGGRIAVPEKHHGGEGAPHKPGQYNDTSEESMIVIQDSSTDTESPDNDESGVLIGEEDDPAQYEGEDEGKEAVAQNTD